MKAIRLKGVAALLAITLVVIFFPNASSFAKEKMQLLMGSTSSTSGLYSGVIALSKILNDNVPEIQVTVVETGATHDNALRMRNGNIQLASASTSDGVIMAYYGMDRWKGKGWPNYRFLNHYLMTAQICAVRMDSGVKSLKDLHGKKFHFGIPGSSTETIYTAVLNKLGVKPQRVVGSLRDAVDMAKDNRIVGLAKASSTKNLDASIADLRSVTPIRIISFTNDEIEQALQIAPGVLRVDIPAGSMKGAEEQGQITTFALTVCNFMIAGISQEIGYKMIKALAEHWKDFTAVSKASATFDPIRDTIRFSSGFSRKVPLHAGVVQFSKEKGSDVPSSLVPPEYK